VRPLATLGRLFGRLVAGLRILFGVTKGVHGLQQEHGARPAEEPDPRDRRLVSTPGRERLVLGLFGLADACAVAFVVLFLTGDDVQLEGLTLGGAFACLAAALAVLGNGVVPQETAVEPRPRLDHPSEHEPLADEVARDADGISRRRLLTAAGLGAGATLGAAIAVPAASLGPAVGDTPSDTPWRRGRLLVDEQDAPIVADDLAEGGFLTAFPQGADKRELGSPVVVVRISPRTLHLPRQRAGWAPEGFLAFSKICTHAGCAITLFRSPKYEPTAGHEPALQCPCHYSTFSVRRGGAVTFGPAPRNLPQLPLVIDGGRRLRAGGPLSGPVGPSWWGVRRQ
jgi:ubiquinol-cytochrome c reductase iron-sulfur subunit